MFLHRSRTLFASLFLSTGAALLVYIFSGISLLITAMLVLVLATVFGSLIWYRSTAADRVYLHRALRAGLIAGLLATGAYDIARFLLIRVTGIAFWPFDIFTVFGRALFGSETSGLWVTAAGVVYHFANGIGFALAYTVWLGRRGIWAGIAWAMVLELMMVSIYPGWLGLKALDEFLQVSVFGHLVYGSVLGVAAQYLLKQKEAQA